MKLFGEVGDVRFFQEKAVFVLLMAITIGAKELFRDSEDGSKIALTSMLLSMVAIPIIVFHMVQRAGKQGWVLSIAMALYVWLIVSAFTEPEKLYYGLEKAHLGLLLPLATGILACRYTKWKEERVLGYIITFALIVLFFGIVYKLTNGFFDRQVKYGLLGPIPFGWVCGMGALAGLLKSNRGVGTVALSMTFVLAVLWSGSKGPAFALAIVAIWKFHLLIGRKRMERLMLAVAIVVGVIAVKESSDNFRASNALQAMLTNSDEYVEGVGAGSVGARLEFYSLSKEMFADNTLFGVGFGAWSLYAKDRHRYPHNLFLEIASETGLVGLVLIVLLLLSLRSTCKVTFIGYFFVLCLLFSGDFSYFRYALFLLIVGIEIGRVDKKPTLRLNHMPSKHNIG